MFARALVVLAVFSLCLSACGVSTPTVSGTADAVYPANHCEIFADKISTKHSSHGIRGFNVFVKLLPERLDGEIKHIVWQAAFEDPENRCPYYDANVARQDCAGIGQVRDYELTRFGAASDYFWTEIVVGSTYEFPHQWHGKFYVETTKGTRYTTSAAGGGDLYLDDHGMDILEAKLLERGLRWYDWDINRWPKTADFYSYVNPGQCR